MIILASTSPRRLEMMKSLRLSFQAIPPRFDEAESGRPPEEEVVYFAREKVRSILDLLPPETRVVVGSDTMVVCEGRKIGKPKDEAEAKAILRFLSGKTHEVISSLVLWRKKGASFKETIDKAAVRFRALTDDEIAAYVATGEPMDKAGAYAVQGKGKKFVVDIRGNMETIVGFPLSILRDWLKEE